MTASAPVTTVTFDDLGNWAVRLPHNHTVHDLRAMSPVIQAIAAVTAQARHDANS